MELLRCSMITLLLFYLNRSECTMTDNRWRNSVIYEIFLQSFKDSNGDGIGDLNGLTSQLPYLADIGVDYLWVTPFYQTPKIENGYEITDYTDILKTFGTISDFDRLMKEMKKHGLKLIMDMVINHSSEKHIWFQKSIKKEYPYTDYYVWKDAKGYTPDGNPIEPNNWVTVFGESAWTWNNDRRQFYLNQFTGSMPDLNLTNQSLMNELINIMKFWLDKGVTGFRLDAVKHFVEDDRFLDEPYVSKEAAEAKSKNPQDLIHIYTFDQPQTFQIIRQIRHLLDEYSATDGSTRILFVEAVPNGPEDKIKNEYYNVSHFPINFSLKFDYKPNFIKPSDLQSIITNTLQNLPQGAVPNWVTDSHDWIRSTNRFGVEVGNALVMLAATLPGIYITYYGQEIGMEQPVIRPDECAYDGGCGMSLSRTPMQWDDNLNGGFTSFQTTWLPINVNYWRVNVEKQKNNTRSQYNLFKRLIELRKKSTFLNERISTHIVSDWVFVSVRALKGEKSDVTFIFNLGSETERVSIDKIPNVHENTCVVIEATENSEHYIGEACGHNDFIMRPKSAVLLETSSH